MKRFVVALLLLFVLAGVSSAADVAFTIRVKNHDLYTPRGELIPPMSMTLFSDWRQPFHTQRGQDLVVVPSSNEWVTFAASCPGMVLSRDYWFSVLAEKRYFRGRYGTLWVIDLIETHKVRGTDWGFAEVAYRVQADR